VPEEEQSGPIVRRRLASELLDSLVSAALTAKKSRRKKAEKISIFFHAIMRDAPLPTLRFLLDRGLSAWPDAAKCAFQTGSMEKYRILRGDPLDMSQEARAQEKANAFDSKPERVSQSLQLIEWAEDDEKLVQTAIREHLISPLDLEFALEKSVQADPINVEQAKRLVRLGAIPPTLASHFLDSILKSNAPPSLVKYVIEHGAQPQAGRGVDLVITRDDYVTMEVLLAGGLPPSLTKEPARSIDMLNTLLAHGFTVTPEYVLLSIKRTLPDVPDLVIKAMLEHLNDIPDKAKDKMLLEAARTNRPLVVQSLVERGADPSKNDWYIWKAVRNAAAFAETARIVAPPV